MSFWENLFKYFALVQIVFGAIQAGMAAIAARQPFTSPPVNTYIEGQHVAVSLSINPV